MFFSGFAWNVPSGEALEFDVGSSISRICHAGHKPYTFNVFGWPTFGSQIRIDRLKRYYRSLHGDQRISVELVRFFYPGDLITGSSGGILHRLTLFLYFGERVGGRLVIGVERVTSNNNRVSRRIGSRLQLRQLLRHLLKLALHDAHHCRLSALRFARN